MNPDPQRIIDEAMQLEPSTRAFIAEALLETLDFEEDFPSRQHGWRKYTNVAPPSTTERLDSSIMSQP